MTSITHGEHRRVRAKRFIAVLFSLLLHTLLLFTFASYVILPEIQELPGLMITPSDPEVWSTEDREGSGVSLSEVLPEQDVDRLLTQIPKQLSATLALPSPDSPQLDVPIEATSTPLVSAERMESMFAAVSSLNPGQPRRSAFEGTVYLFDRAKRVRTGNAWFRGKGKEESPQKLYTYALWVPGRDDKRVPHAVPLEKRWIGVDYKAQLYWPERLSGVCSFRLTSDAAAVLQIDGLDVIDHDGSHGFRPMETILRLEPGPHQLRLAYLQGPRSKLGLLLHYQTQHSAGWQLLDLRDILRENVTAMAHPLRDE